MSQCKESGANQETGRSPGSLRRLEAATSQGHDWHEPYESRGSRTDLWETGGEIPPVYPAERIANELLLKLGLRVSPRTVRKYMPGHCVGDPGTRRQSQRWSTFIRNHAQGIVACDFCVVVTATVRILYVFVVIEHVSRRLLHVNVTAHPTAQWTLHQLREAIPSDHAYRLLIHDRDTIFSLALDQNIRNLGLRVLKTPPRCPQANAICERVLGTHGVKLWTS